MSLSLFLSLTKLYRAFLWVLVALFATGTSRKATADTSNYLPVSLVHLAGKEVNCTGMTVLPNGNLCLSTLDSNGLLFISQADFKTLKFIPMSSLPCRLQLNPVRPEFYVISFERPSVWVFDSEKMAFSRLLRLPAEAHPGEIAITHDGKTAWISDSYKPLVYALDLQTGEVVDQMPLSFPARRILLTQDASRLYVGEDSREDTVKPGVQTQDPEATHIDVYDLKAKKQVETLTIKGNGIAGLALDALEQNLFVLSEEHASLSAVALKTPHTTKSIPMPGDQQPRGQSLFYDQGNGYLYVASRGLNAGWTSFVDPSSFKIVNRVMSGTDGGEMAAWRSPDSTCALLYSLQSMHGPLTITDLAG